MTDPYTRLVELAQAEHSALLEGDIEGLEPINRERRELMSTLPVRAPQAARPMLTEAARLQVRNQTLLEALRARIGARLTQNGRARDTARGYAKQVASAGPNFFRSA
jgi:hypothetical protein